MKDSEYCWCHNPETKEQRMKAGRLRSKTRIRHNKEQRLALDNLLRENFNKTRGLTVILDQNIQDSDIELIKQAIYQIRHVVEVRPIIINS